MGLASYAMSPKKDMSEMEEITVQKVGMREDSEKKTYEPYTSRERSYESQWACEGVEVEGIRTMNVLKSTQL